MAEIEREPIEMVDDQGNDYQAFDENHTINDIIRYAIACSDLEEVADSIRQMQEGSIDHG